MVTPEQLSKAQTEHAHQTAFFCWVSQNLEQFPMLKFMHSIPNGGLRDKITASRMKAEGAKSGVPDICLPYRTASYSGLYIEMKRPDSVGKKEGRLTDDQKIWIEFLEKQNFSVKVCYGYLQAIEAVVQFLTQV